MSEDVVVVPADTPDTVVVVPGGEYARVDHTHDAGDVVAPHVHDDLYYTEAETDALLADTAAAVHTHDDLYYTEGEVDTALDGKVSKSGDTMTGTLAVGPSNLLGNPAKNNVPVNIKRTDDGFVALSFARDVLHYYLGQPADLSNFRLYKYAGAGGSASRIVLQYIPATDTLDLTGPLAVTVPAPTADDHAARKIDVDNARIQTVQSIEDIPVDATTDDVFAVYDPLSTIDAVAGPAVVGLVTGGIDVGSPLPVSRPMGLKAGDWLLAWIVDQTSSGSGDYTAPGWTRVGPAYQDPDAVNRFSLLMAKKVTDPSSEPFAYEFTAAWVNTSRKAVSLLVLRGADPLNPIDVSTGYRTTGSVDGTYEFDDLTATTDGLWLGFFGAQASSGDDMDISAVSNGFGTFSDWQWPLRDGSSSASVAHVVGGPVSAGAITGVTMDTVTEPAQSCTVAVVVK